MAVRRVHWHEGMFLRPQHFQSAQHFVEADQLRGASWNNHFYWGLRRIELDATALENFRLVVRAVDASMRDGLHLSIPEDGTLAPVDLKEALAREKRVTVFLAVPTVSVGRANVSDPTSTAPCRYRLDSQTLEDENTGVNPQPLTVRALNIHLLLSTQDHTGYEVLPIARIARKEDSEASPELDVSYVPPVLACDAWKALGSEILDPIFDRIGKKIELLASQVVSRDIGLDSHGAGDQLLISQLRELNEAYAVFTFLTSTPGIHPREAFLEMCRLAGQLSIFGATRRTPDLPRYNHDDLAGCFYQLKRHIDELLNIVVEPQYKARPFVGAGMRMQVVLEPVWLESVWRMYIGVQSQIDAEACIRLLTMPGQLDMKMGSSDRVDSIFRMGQAGLRFSHIPRPPRSLPSAAGLIYFQINRESQEQEWQNVQRSLTLAIRLNETLILGNIQGQEVLSIRTGGESTTMRFTLYVVPQDAK